MGIGNRVMVKPVGSGTVFNTATKEDMVLVYKPIIDSKGNFVFDSSSSIMVERVGGVKAGSTGVISGPSIKVQRKALMEYADTTAAFGPDTVDMYPVTFDAYSGIGFLPGDALKQI